MFCEQRPFGGIQDSMSTPVKLACLYFVFIDSDRREWNGKQYSLLDTFVHLLAIPRTQRTSAGCHLQDSHARALFPPYRCRCPHLQVPTNRNDHDGAWSSLQDPPHPPERAAVDSRSRNPFHFPDFPMHFLHPAPTAPHFCPFPPGTSYPAKCCFWSISTAFSGVANQSDFRQALFRRFPGFLQGAHERYILGPCTTQRVVLPIENRPIKNF